MPLHSVVRSLIEEKHLLLKALLIEVQAKQLHHLSNISGMCISNE